MPWIGQTSTGDHTQPKIVKTYPNFGKEIPSFSGGTFSIRFNRGMDPSMEKWYLTDQPGSIDEQGRLIEIQGGLAWPDPYTLQFSRGF